MDGCLVDTNQHTATVEIAQLADRRLGFLRQPQDAVGIVLEDTARFGQCAVFRRPIEEPLANLVFESADGLTDRRLGSMELRCSSGKTSLGGDGEKNAQLGQIHRDAPKGSKRPLLGAPAPIIIESNNNFMNIRLDDTPGKAVQARVEGRA